MIAPSILNINNLDLKDDIKVAADAGITKFHIDIMDGHFVPNLSFGPQLVSDFKNEFPDLEAEIHLMSNNPSVLVPAFVNAGANMMLLHYEAMKEDKLAFWLDYLQEHHVGAGIVLNPNTPVSALRKFTAKIDQVLLMTVQPGFGGQKFIPESEMKIRQTVKMLNDKIPVEVDGGIDAKTAKIAKNAGARIFVAGSYLFCQNSVSEQIRELQEIVK